MSKEYVIWYKFRTVPEERYRVDVWFSPYPDKAMYWDTRAQAEADCDLFERWQIEIPSSQGGTHVCVGFRVEQRTANEFVVCCDGPFIPRPVAQVTRDQ